MINLRGINFNSTIHAFFENVDSGYIQTINTPHVFKELPDVDMDRFMVCVGFDKAVGTSGVGSCFAICARGLTAENTPVIALAHKSSIVAIRDVFHELKKEMVKQGCVKNTIKTVVIGGESPTRDNPEGTIEEEREFFSLARKQKTQEMLFNFAKGEAESLSVVVTPAQIYVSKECLFESIEDVGAISLLGEDSDSF